MAAPLDNATAEVVYDWLGRALTDPDEEHGWALAELVNAAAESLYEVEQVTRGSDGRPGWAIALDPDTVPAALLPWLAQFVGVAYDGRLAAAQMRTKIKERPYHKRGTVEAILAAARPWLSTGEVTLIERDGSAYRLTVEYTADQVGAPTLDEVAAAYTTLDDVGDNAKYLDDLLGNETELQEAVLAAKPVGLVVSFTLIP